MTHEIAITLKQRTKALSLGDSILEWAGNSFSEQAKTGREMIVKTKNERKAQYIIFFF